jgi:long-chain acyl-CoA synthetase
MNDTLEATAPTGPAAYPAGVDWSAPISQAPLTEAFDRSVALYGSNICIDFLGRRYSYEEIGAMVGRAAKGLQDLGVGKGVRVGLLLPNSPYAVICYYAVLKAGGTVVNFNPLYVAEEIERQIQDSETRIMVTMDLRLTLPKVSTALGRTPLERVVVCSMAEALPFAKSSLFRFLGRGRIAELPEDGLHVTFAELTDNDGDFLPAAISPQEDIAVLQYTGGTTGIPMGAMLTHANIAANARQVAMWDPDMKEGEERIIGVLPLFHVFAMTVVMNMGLLIGAELVLLPRFEIAMVMKALKRRQPTQFPGVPSLFHALLEYPKLAPEDLQSLEFCLSGGAPLPTEIRTAFEALTGCRLVEGYGLTETSPVVTCSPLKNTVRQDAARVGVSKDGSVGLALPGTRIEIRSLEAPEKALGVGESGEVCIAGPQTMAGYWDSPEATANTLKGGWVHTGDVGYLDEDGFLFLIDRIKDLIICSGYNVYPRVVEEAIYRHPAVAEVTVTGVPDEDKGEVPKAYVRLKQDQALSAEELLAFLEDKLSRIERPRHVEFRDELPKTMIGKLSKKELVAEERARQAATGHTDGHADGHVDGQAGTEA